MYMDLEAFESSDSGKEKIKEVEQIKEKEEIKEEPKEEVKKDVDPKTAKLDLSKYKVKSIIGVIPIEPVVVFCNIEEKDNPSGDEYRTIGLAGFYDVKNSRFFKLDGSSVDMEGFENSFNQFVKEKVEKGG